MDFFVELLITVLLATSLMFVVSSRLLHCIKLAAVQGVILGIFPVIAHHGTGLSGETLVSSFINTAIKGIILPLLLTHALRKAKVRREVEPFISYSASLIIFIIVMVLSFWCASRVELPLDVHSPLALPTAFITIYTGIFLVISRRKALTQAIGFLVFENGIGLFGHTIMIHHSFVVELGILLDVFVLIFVMGIALFHIRHEFHHIDTDKLNQLGDFDSEEV